MPRCGRRFVLPALAVLLCLALSGNRVYAQFLPFGKNKINYEQFEWQILRTEHFDIYYYPEMEDLARRGGYFAETSFRKLEQEFNFTIVERIPLILYSSPLHFQQTNISPGFIPEGVGGFFEFLKGRVVIPASGSMAQLRHVINHELVHVFMHTKIMRVFDDYNIQSDRYPPLWFVEGLAEYYSTEWDSQAEMLLRDAVLNGYFAPISQIFAISGTFLMYKEGQAALMFMEKRYGKETILRLIDNLWRSAFFSDVMKITLGATYEEFDEAWTSSLKKQYFPLLATHDKPSTVTTELAGSGFNTAPVVYYEGDSAYVVYLANRDGYASIYRKSFSPGEPELVIRGEKTDDMESFHQSQNGMSVSKNGDLAYVSKSGGTDVLHIYNLRMRERKASVRITGIVMLGSVSWSPDGSRLALTGIDRAGNSDLYIYNTETGAVDRLTNDIYNDIDPAWSPDGTAIAFASDRQGGGAAGNHNLFLYNLESASISYLTNGPADYRYPSWSADGALLACTSDLEGTQNIYLIRAPSSPNQLPPHLFRLTSFTTAAASPIWTSKGSLVFGAFDTYSFQLRGIKDVAAGIDSLEKIPQRPVVSVEPWSAPFVEGETGASRLQYEKRYTLDLAQSQIATDPVFGTIGGAALSVSDMLSNERYYFLLYNTAQTSSEILSNFNIAISRISLENRHPYAYGVFHYSGRRYDILDEDTYYYERAFGGYFALAYPFSKFRRIEGNISLTNSDKDVLNNIRQRKALLLTNSISYVKDNALYWYTGPIDGNRFNLTLAYTTDVQYSNVNYYSLMADYRRYFRIGLRSCLAVRTEFLYNHGKEARRYFLGGSWDLRGWDRWSIRGTKRWLSSVELRFPLLDRFGLDFPFGTLNLGLLTGAFYADAGNCWDTKYGETLGSIGAGLRLSLWGMLVLRYDFGKRIENNFSSLQNGLYQQFFFGWDF